MHPPPKGHVWVPKTTTPAAGESERPSSSKSTQNASSRISRAITRAVSNILPSSSSRQSNLASGNRPSNRPSRSATGSTPSPGLSSILSRRVACEPTSSDALPHAEQLTSGAADAPGATSSQATNNRRSVRKETMPNPILQTNLLTTTPTFKDAGVTAPHVAGNYSRKPPLIPGISSSTDPVLRNPIPPINQSRKGKRSTSTRSARKSAAPSPVSGCSKPAPGSSGGFFSRTGPILRPDLHIPNSADKVSGGASSRVSGQSKLVNFTSDQQHPQNVVHSVSANKSLANVSASDPKGKGAVTSGNQTFKRKALDNKSVCRSYEQLFKDHYISSSAMYWLPIAHQLIPAAYSDQLELGLIALGEKCQLCAIDLAFLPYNSSSGTSTDPPVCAVLPCGHTLHASCLEQVYGSSLEPQCLSCASSSPKVGKQN